MSEEAIDSIRITRSLTQSCRSRRRISPNGYAGIAAKEREELIAKARASATKALELDSNLAEAHFAQGVILQDLDFNLVAAEAELRRAFELATQNATATANLGSLLATLGRLDEAVALVQRAIALEPLRAASYGNLANYLTALGRYNEAEAAARKAIALQPQSAQSCLQLAIIQILAAKPALPSNWPNRKPTRSGAPTHWPWPISPTATALKPTRP